MQRLSELQEKLYAQDRWAVLLIFQAMDAAGKDGTIKHVMSGVNPQGVDVHAIKQPSAEELDHDFLWRSAQRLPERGRIGIFNRSYYEEVLVVRVHETILRAQQLPPELVTERIWRERRLTVLFVTHNVREAVRLGDRVVLMQPSPGRVDIDIDIDISRPRRIDSPEVSERARWFTDRLQTQPSEARA